jgi:hypothetical protein
MDSKSDSTESLPEYFHCTVLLPCTSSPVLEVIIRFTDSLFKPLTIEDPIAPEPFTIKIFNY